MRPRWTDRRDIGSIRLVTNDLHMPRAVYELRKRVDAQTLEILPDAVTSDRIRVTHLWCSHDCGAMVDARSVRAQVEGNLVWSLSLVLFEELTAPQARPVQTQLADYPLPRITDMPRLDIDLVPSDRPPSGAGEAAIVAGAGAIYNALVAACGRQFAPLPVRFADLA